MRRLPIIISAIMFVICLLLCLVPLFVIWCMGGYNVYAHFFKAFDHIIWNK